MTIDWNAVRAERDRVHLSVFGFPYREQDAEAASVPASHEQKTVVADDGAIINVSPQAPEGMDELDRLLAEDGPEPAPAVASVVSAAPVALPTGAALAYEFPRVDLSLPGDEDSGQLLAELQGLLESAYSSGELLGYFACRERVCQLSVMLNMLGKIAPRFRPLRPATNSKKAGSPDQVWSRDRQVIDLHWGHEQGQGRAVDTRKDFGEIFTGGSFNFEQAGKLACMGWKRGSKFDATGFEFALGAELAVIQPEAMAKAWEHIESSRHTWRNQFTYALRRRRNLLVHVEDWVDVRTVMELLGADAPVRELARLVARKTGTSPIDDRAMERKRGVVKKHLGMS